jgi:uncharacterized protein YndB with AHSA1/START domain
MKDRARGYAHRIDITAGVTHVWHAITDAESLTRWCSPKAEIRARKGGLFRVSIDRSIELEAHIDVFDPGRRMRLIYLPSSSLPPADSVLVDDFIVEPAPDCTVVRLLGSGIPADAAWDLHYRRLRMGWQSAMARLKVYIEKQLQAATPVLSNEGAASKQR